jgi:hypothetical protein
VCVETRERDAHGGRVSRAISASRSVRMTRRKGLQSSGLSFGEIVMRRGFLLGFALAMVAMSNVGCDSSPPPSTEATEAEKNRPLKPDLKPNPKLKKKNVEMPTLRR